ncbi:hypothetical protein KBX37_06445 [Micromonospora sp. U56]|uniref:hypothetical protein n=1 Tax=Micromonospora sp. U56 TaxID=2824900 RepID=UPI001B36B568|nr:hypothetical protein [Micromonospora sp. U56]
MRFVRSLVGMLLLVVGIPALLAGGGLSLVAGHASTDGTFSARFEPVRSAGRAVVVQDVDALLRAEAPFTRVGGTRLRLTARTADGPAFVGLGPADEVRRWLAPVPHGTVDRIALARGPLPVRLTDADAAPTAGPAGAVPPAPLDAPFWVREGIGAVEWTPGELAGRRLILVVMRPDGGAGLALDLRAEVRSDWFRPVAWGALAGGLLLIVLAVLVLLRPVRPREVVFVVEPDQVPVLAGRLGVSSLSGLGAAPEPEPQLVSIGAPERSRAAIGAVPARRPATLADLPPWPPERPEETAEPVPGSPRPAGAD